MATVFKRGGSRAKGPWYIQWFDHHGKRQTKSTRTTDKATAERITKKYEADAALRREGVIDPALDAIAKESARSIESHLADYENKLRTADRSPGHIKDTIRYVRKIAATGNWQTAVDISADDVHRFANNLQEQGLSARTVQAYLTAKRRFPSGSPRMRSYHAIRSHQLVSRTLKPTVAAFAECSYPRNGSGCVRCLQTS